MPRRRNNSINNRMPNGVRNGNGNGRRVPVQGLLFVGHGTDIVVNPALKKLTVYKNAQISKKVTWKQIKAKQERVASLERILRNEIQFAESTADKEETQRLIAHEKALLEDMLKRAPKRKKTLAEVAYEMVPRVNQLLDQERRISERQRIILKTFLKKLRQKKITGRLVREVDMIIKAIQVMNQRTQ